MAEAAPFQMKFEEDAYEIPVAFEEDAYETSVDFEEDDRSVSVDFEQLSTLEVSWSAIKDKPFETLGKGLKVVDGGLVVSVVEQVEDLASIYNLTQQAALRDSGELTTYLEKFAVAHYSTAIGNGHTDYVIRHNLNSEHIILQVWPIVGDLPSYTAGKLNENEINIIFESPILTQNVVLTVTKVEYSVVDMVPWSNVSNVRYSTREEMLKILKGED